MLLQASDHRDDVECAEIVEQLLEDVCAEIEDEVRSRHDIQMLYVHMHVRLRMKRLRIKYAAGMISRCYIVICYIIIINANLHQLACACKLLLFACIHLHLHNTRASVLQVRMCVYVCVASI